MEKMISMVCPECGSDDLVCDAAARWNMTKQKWVLSSTMDNVTCQNCEAEFHTPYETFIMEVQGDE